MSGSAETTRDEQLVNENANGRDVLFTTEAARPPLISRSLTTSAVGVEGRSHNLRHHNALAWNDLALCDRLHL